MITTFSNYNQNIQPNSEQEALIGEYLESYRPKICCLESYWSKSMTDPLSVKPFLKSIGWMLEKDIVVAHRFIDSGEGLAYYTKYPNGIIWQDPLLAGIDVFYIAAHGVPGGILTPQGIIESDELISAFEGLNTFDTIVYFGGCEVIGGKKGEEFAREFLSKTGAVAVIGYKHKASWVDSVLIDTLFLSRFFEVEGNHFTQLKDIYLSVVKDYPLAVRCGFNIYTKI